MRRHSTASRRAFAATALVTLLLACSNDVAHGYQVRIDNRSDHDVVLEFVGDGVMDQRGMDHDPASVHLVVPARTRSNGPHVRIDGAGSVVRLMTSSCELIQEVPVQNDEASELVIDAAGDITVTTIDSGSIGGVARLTDGPCTAP